MPNQLRFRSGVTQLIKVRVDADTVIEAGDMVWLNTDDVRPASAYAWETDLLSTQESFAEFFLGIAHEPSPAGETAPISVDISPLAIYEMDCPPGNYEVGRLMAPWGTTPNLKNQSISAAAGDGIARAVEYRTNADTLRVTFASAWHTASNNSDARVS